VLGVCLVAMAVHSAWAEDAPLRLASSAALRATVFGPPPQAQAALPETVPMEELDFAIEGGLPVPELYWFNRRLRAYLSVQPQEAPLAIVISGTGGTADTQKLRLFRRALYGAGYHVLTLPSPTSPGFIVAASSTGVAGELRQDGMDMHRVIRQIVPRLRERMPVSAIHVLGYSLGGAHAALVKAIDDQTGAIGIGRAVLVNPPVNLYNAVNRLDELLSLSVGDGDGDFERLYRELYTKLAHAYVLGDATQVDQDFLFAAVAQVLRSDRERAAGIALVFRLSLIDMFLAGDIYAGTGVLTEPGRPPGVSESLVSVMYAARNKTFQDYFVQVLAPYYLMRRPGATLASLIADSHLRIIESTLAENRDYYVQTNRDELILDGEDLAWLQGVFGTRLALYDHGGHMGNFGEREQINDMLDMLAGRFGDDTP